MKNIENIMVIGGAGFIGSNTVEELLSINKNIIVFDNFSTGKISNLKEFETHKNLTIINGDILNNTILKDSIKKHNIEGIIHLAAQVSVKSSIENPENSFNINIHGFLNVLNAIKEIDNTIKLVYASSAAIYGDNENLPLKETEIFNPTSNYGLEKSINEQFASLYKELHDINSIGLRYFNVYGPKQDPSSGYSGVISIFIDKIMKKENIKIFGDGNQYRDFIFVKDVAKVNIKSLFSNSHNIFNVGTGKKDTINQLAENIQKITKNKINIEYKDKVKGDIYASLSNPIKLNNHLNIKCETNLQDGLKQLIDFLK